MTDNYKDQIEALLFACARFMDYETLLRLTGASNKQVLTNNINKLKKEYNERNSPLMIVEEKDGWKLTVREPFLPLVRNIVSETELPKTILETLAVIAWKAPVLQSDVVNVRHNKAYEHISELQELGFIKKEIKGRSYLINLTEKFYEYFDVEGSKDIRDVFKKVVGSPDQLKVDDFEGSELSEELKENGELEKNSDDSELKEGLVESGELEDAENTKDSDLGSGELDESVESSEESELKETSDSENELEENEVSELEENEESELKS